MHRVISIEAIIEVHTGSGPVVAYVVREVRRRSQRLEEAGSLLSENPDIVYDILADLILEWIRLPQAPPRQIFFDICKAD